MIRVGASNFVNAFPFFFALKKQIIPNNVEMHWGAPAETNEMLKSGQVDVALISSASFLSNRFSYVLLSDMGIASTKKSVSIRLFFKGDKTELDSNFIYVTSLGITSTRLLQVLCRYFWNVSPAFQSFDGPPKKLFEQDVPFMLIGDECLKGMENSQYSSIDLAQAWNEVTRKSLIFAMIATRNDAFKRNPYGIIEFHRLLENSFAWAKENPLTIAKEAAVATECTVETMNSYYNTIEYRLMSKHFHGLDYFTKFEI